MKYILNKKEISTCMIGTWAWGGGLNGSKMVFGKSYGIEQLRETFEQAYSLGFNFWDTAPVYGMGNAEKILGEFIKGKDVVISTKHRPIFGHKDGEVRKTIEKSLQRLGVSCIDLFWLHSPKSIVKNMVEFAQCQKDGLIKSIGLSNGSIEQIHLADKTLRENGSKLDAVQNHYSLLSFEREAATLEYCKQNNILYFGYMILEQGALSGHYSENNHFPLLSFRGMLFGKQKFRKIQPLLDYAKQLAEKYSVDPSQIPIAWAISKGVIPLVGLTKAKHGDSLKAGLATILDEAEAAQLEKLALDSGVVCKAFWE